MRLLVTGLGDIAHKAYLPVLSMLPDVELHLATRNRQVLDQAGRSFRVAGLHSSIEDALRAGRFDAAFVHAATDAHPALVQTLLEQRIPVFVDKPLADHLAEVERLVALAQRQKTLLTVGFNRRFAPSHVALYRSQADLIVMEKHRHRQPDVPRRVIFDDFIHVVDTLLFLAPGPVQRHSIETRVDQGMLISVTLTLAGDGFTAIGIMHRDSGLNEERLDVIGSGVRHSVVNMADEIRMDGRESRQRRGDWTTVGKQRGFEAMCLDFLAGVSERRQTNSEAILTTHRLCEAIVIHAEGS